MCVQTVRKDISQLYHSVVSPTDEPRHELCDVLLSVEHNLTSMYQLGTRIEITHAPCGPVDDFVRADNAFSCRLVNPFTRPMSVPPFETAVPEPIGPDGDPAFQLKEYTISNPADGEVLFRLMPADVRQSLREATGETVFSSDRRYDVPPETVVQIAYVSNRVIPFNDTYMYLAHRRPLRDLLLTYHYGKLEAAIRLRGMHLRPKLTLVSNTVKIGKETKTDDTREWELSGWLLLGSGIVLSW